MRVLSVVGSLALLLTSCGGAGAASDAAVVTDAGTLDAPPDAPGPDTGPPDAGLGCVSAESGFPRRLGLPEPAPDGVFDPDLVRDPSTGTLWISYSAVDGPPGVGRVSTHLAYSEDDGATWCHAGAVNESVLIGLDALPPGVSGTRAHWSHETSAIVHDPDAPSDARWRMLWHRYLHVDEVGRPDGRRFEYGWIAERIAATPLGLIDAEERKLFSSAAYYASGSITAFNEAAPGGTPQRRLDALPGLAGCVVATEPALLAHDGALLVALFCASSATENQIALLELDHTSGTWTMLGTLIASADAPAIDPTYDGFNAADLFKYGSRFGLLLTPTTTSRYRGCLVFEVDLDRTTLRDDAGDGPDVHFAVPLGTTASAPFGGACTFLEGTALGLITGEVRTTGTTFTLSATGITNLTEDGVSDW